MEAARVFTRESRRGACPPHPLADRGVQCAATSYQAALDENNIVCSMSRKGDCWDSAVSESFFGTLKTELINRWSWSTRREAKDAVVEYIESFYNPHP